MAELDRRVRRTRRTLHEAFISLVIDRGYDQLTVQDILDRADVGRSTFYAHYRDKEALLLASFDDVRDQLQRETEELTGRPMDPTRPVELLFEHAHRHQRVYRALCGRRGGTAVLRYLHGLLAGLLTDHLRPRLAAAGSPLPAAAVAEFCTSAALGLLTWWIDHDFDGGPAALSTTYRTLALPGLRAALTPAAG